MNSICSKICIPFKLQSTLFIQVIAWKSLQAIKSFILTLVLPNHGNGVISHDNLYKTAFNPSKCTRPMIIKSFDHFLRI